MSGNQEYDIFVSYTHEDIEPARRLADALQAQGWSIFWDRVLLPGATWRTQIQTALNTAKVVIVLWSAKSVESRWVEIEADHAFQRDAYIPVKIDNSALPLGLSHIQVADLRPWHADPAQPLPDLLLSALKRRLGAGTSPGGSPPVSAPVSAPVVRAPSQPAQGDSDSTVIAADGVIKFAGAAPDGEKFELAVRLSQLRLKPQGLVIGRNAGQADLLLTHFSVSRRHALLKLAGGGLTLSDLGSTNGTFVDNRPVLPEQPAEVVGRAAVRLGEVELRVEPVGTGLVR